MEPLGRPMGRLGGAALACEVVAQSSAADNSFSPPETRLRQVAHRRPLRRGLCVTCADLRLTAPERVVRCTQNVSSSTLLSTYNVLFHHKNTSDFIDVSSPGRTPIGELAGSAQSLRKRSPRHLMDVRLDTH